jgi:type III restriction enzyme
MELKEYQQRVLNTFDIYLEELGRQRALSLQVEELSRKNPDLNLETPDFPAKTWAALKKLKDGILPENRLDKVYSPRKDGIGRSVPSVCFKVPTGGGKTLLAAASVSRLFGKFLKSNQGFVLWIVPNEAIYSQTKRILTNREHPYRQMLDIAGAGKFQILEKDDPLSNRDVESNLCVMLLMLQAANRQSKETLKVFRDRGNVHGFFPNEADGEAHRSVLHATPNLDSYSDTESFWPVVKDSLGNVLRSIRPVVVIDEGHKAYSLGATETLYGFNPCFVLELSATPKDRPKQDIHSNWLVDIRGSDLDREEMIKLPINVKVKSGDDWHGCVQDSVAQLNALQRAAEKLQAQSARYIRPILLVQVERTGREHREAGFVHADDVKDYLLRIGFREEEIAFKTSQVNELKSTDLLSATCPIRAIITKQALQEGWDCPFAYVLCSLSATRSLNAMTQLVGRILRQPDATRVGTSLGALDECYVFCHHASTKEIVEAIKTGLENDGMGDLAIQIKESFGDGPGKSGRRTIKRRESFAKNEIYLPLVNYLDGEIVRPLDYEQDVIFHLNWDAITIEELADRISPEAHTHPSQVTKITLTDVKGELIRAEEAAIVSEESLFDPVYSTRVITDIVPNPWLARELVQQLTSKLQTKGFTSSKLGELSSYILEELRNHLMKERDRLAEQRFLADVAAEIIQFRLRADRGNWAMPALIGTELADRSPLLYRDDGKVIQKSVFSPVYKDDFNSEEAEFACYIDEEKALQWWHKNVARAGHYFVQGWRKNKVYPDFIFALQKNNGKERLIVLETKGDQLAGNLDTSYKRSLLERLSKAYRQDDVVKAGELQLVSKGKEVLCDLVLMSEAKTEFHKRYIEADDAAIVDHK